MPGCLEHQSCLECGGLSSQAHVTRNDLSRTPPSVNKVIVILQPPRKGDEARPPALAQWKRAGCLLLSPEASAPPVHACTSM